MIIVNAFPVEYKGRVLEVGNHADKRSEYHEHMLQQAIVNGEDFYELWRHMLNTKSMERCSIDTHSLIFKAAHCEFTNRKGGRPKQPAYAKFKRQLEIMHAYIEAVRTGQAKVEASKNHSNDIYSGALIALSNPHRIGGSYSIKEIKTTLHNFGLSIKELKAAYPHQF